ncbi:hypothetical protein M1D51_19470 [Arthrobacter sp. R3-55]
MMADILSRFPLARVEPGDWDWTAWGTIATGSAAVVTAVTVVFVAFQTRATRKAANEAKRSADAANRALDYAQTQLDYAHQQHLQSLYVTAETVRTRIDAEMPRLVIEEATILKDVKVSGGAALPEAIVDPHDRNLEVEHSIRIRIKNDGPKSAKLLFNRPIKYHVVDAARVEGINQLAGINKDIPVGVGETLAGEFTLSRPAGFWMDTHQARVAGGGELANYPQLNIRSLTDADSGAHESHTITLTGTALVPVPHDKGRWIHRLYSEVNGEISELSAFIEPAQRTYFISRLRNELLPALAWKDIAEVPKRPLGTGSQYSSPPPEPKSRPKRSE